MKKKSGKGKTLQELNKAAGYTTSSLSDVNKCMQDEEYGQRLRDAFDAPPGEEGKKKLKGSR